MKYKNEEEEKKRKKKEDNNNNNYNNYYYYYVFPQYFGNKNRQTISVYDCTVGDVEYVAAIF